MVSRHYSLSPFLIVLLLLCNPAAFAQLSVSSKFKTLLKDSSAYSLFNDRYHTASKDNYGTLPADLPATKEVSGHLLNNLEGIIKKSRERKSLLKYLKSMEIENTSGSSQSKARFYYRLANTFARLRLYPLAMKCFLKTVPKSPNEAVMKPGPMPELLASADPDPLDSLTGQSLSINGKDDSLINRQAIDIEKKGSSVKSKAITYQLIHQTFDDGKKAVAYAMLFHVKQPVRGKRKIFVLNNVGHTFITLIKYNSDSTYSSVSLGFYPKKDNPLSATPLIPTTTSVFKDDSGHAWDEILGKFISKRKFERIQGLILQYNGLKYNLSKNNCTDFGIKAAGLAGISMQETYGTWPLGRGNNPAITGQSILEHKFYDNDHGNADRVFVDTLMGITW